MTTETVYTRLARLEERVRELERKRQTDDPTCPLCGGRASKSTKFPRIFCFQEYGPCGELALPAKSHKGDCRPVFHRTSIENDGQIFPFTPQWKMQVHLFFIGGCEVTEREYDKAREKAEERA